MTDAEANAKMDVAVAALEKEFPECLFVIVALTDNQTATRYVSNLGRRDAQEVVMEVTSRPDFIQGGDNGYLN